MQMYQHNTELMVKENTVAKKLETLKILKTDRAEPLASILASLGMRICSLLLPSPPSVVALTSIK